MNPILFDPRSFRDPNGMTALPCPKLPGREGAKSLLFLLSAQVVQTALKTIALSLSQVFEEMTNEGVKPNAVTYNAVMDAYAKANDHAAALTWLEKMRADGVTPNVVTYTTLINACGRAGRIEEAARVLDEAGENSVNVVRGNVPSCPACCTFCSGPNHGFVVKIILNDSNT